MKITRKETTKISTSQKHLYIFNDNFWRFWAPTRCSPLARLFTQHTIMQNLFAHLLFCTDSTKVVYNYWNRHSQHKNAPDTTKDTYDASNKRSRIHVTIANCCNRYNGPPNKLYQILFILLFVNPDSGKLFVSLLVKARVKIIYYQNVAGIDVYNVSFSSFSAK